ncbi:MAG TPA: glutamate synthase large subunit [Aeromicrobium sp.]|nr:glutamate synthase large subunit [Aeromicrobium sp.]
MARPLFSAAPSAQGLYDPANEHDNCGVAFVATLTGVASNEMVNHGLTALRNLDHRGAVGGEPNTGDGAGILLQTPDKFLRAVAPTELPPAGSYAAGMAFLPADDVAGAKAQVEQIALEEGLSVLGWREVPTKPEILGSMAQSAMPAFEILYVAAAGAPAQGIELDRLTFALNKRSHHEAQVYFPSLSARTFVYKGMLTTEQLDEFYPDLLDPRMESALAIVHSRFSTNTFPSWPLAHPFRYLAHNGEINTARGNRNWMRAREALLESKVIPGDLSRLYPICSPDGSDTASLDEVLELLHLGGRSLPHAVMMMIPESWENNSEMDPARRAFYEFHSTVMEAWDGPACVCFTDGTQIGAVLDRNGLRPGRYWITEDGLVVLASESGVLDLDPATVIRKGRLEPGKMFLLDLDEHRVIEDHEIKNQLANENPYEEWLYSGLVRFEDLPDLEHIVHTHASVKRRQQLFGYTEEDVRKLIAPIARTGAETIGSMGTDTPIAALSERPRMLFDYFSQLFAQVTNPPLDAIREEIVTSLAGTIGPERNLLDPSPASCRMLQLPFPVIDSDELAKIRHMNRDGDMPGFSVHVVRGLYSLNGGGEAMAARLEEICAEVSDAIVNRGARIIVISDRNADVDFAPIPSLLLTGAVHHHLVREKLRTQAGLLIEAGDVREVHHVALLIGYGATAVNPYLALETAEDLAREGVYVEGIEPQVAARNIAYGLGKGVLKVMSKIGVSTVSSYTGAQIFECIGLSQDVIDRYFTGTSSKLGGVGLDVLATEVRSRHDIAYPLRGLAESRRQLEVGGEYQWRRQGPEHLFDPDTVFRLQHSTRTGRYDIFKQYTEKIDHQSNRLMTLRGLMKFRGERAPISIDEVESVAEIVKRFSTGAMSYGSISQEAHETLAIAMNQLGGKSNTGEGGEDPERLYDPARRSAIKQVASGRFGVTSEYLTNADDIQIKMAQGAKPGEGGQLPGPKVYPWVAKTRHSTPGVGLISPPPHHDIYSIEDLKQLIHDLKNANPVARVHVKLVSEVGVGTVAAGVSKAKADVVLISGHDGGTGASPLTSLKHAGGPWELGLAETQQTLLLNGLRDRIVVQVDGQLKTGRDVVIAALLGGEEFGFATAPLVVSGCIMMRVCHLDTCPVGVATQNVSLREKFSGKAEYVVNFFEFIAQEVREILADLGLRSIDEAVGRVDLLDVDDAIEHWKADALDLSPILYQPQLPAGASLRCTTGQEHGLDNALDVELIKMSQDALERGELVRIALPIRNVNRTTGTMLGHEVTKRYRGAGLPDDTIDITFSGSAGQSFGAFVPRGITLRLQGDGNDYVGKGLSGGRIIVSPAPESSFTAEAQIIAGNVIGFGATGGEIYLRGMVGERFCVRNSGATAVVEGVGDHALEYMTGGRVVILGKTGRNVAAGMSGGSAYVLDLDHSLVNREMVELRPVPEETSAELEAILRKHLAETGSAVAERLLGDWANSVSRFTEIMPVNYRLVLEAKASAEAEGLSDEQTTARMMEVAARG